MKLRTLTAIGAVLGAAAFIGGSSSTTDASAAPSQDASAPIASVDGSRSTAAKGVLPLVFEANHGQIDGPARFFCRRGPVATFFNDDAFVVRHETRVDDERVSGVAVELKFENARPTTPRPGAPAPTRVNYFRGSDASGFIVDVPTYASLVYPEIYDGVDVVVRDGGGAPEYDVILAPHAKAEDVVIRVVGGDSMRLQDGALIVSTAKGELAQYSPKTWETLPDGTKRDLKAEFRIVDAERFGFSVEDRTEGSIVTVDPILVFASYLGGVGLDETHGVAVSTDGHAFITGRTSSSDYPRTTGCYDNVKSGSYEAFVTKMSVDGSSLVYSTYLGSNGSDLGEEIVVTSAGEAIVSGWLGGSGFPTTTGAYDTSYNGYSDVFVTKFNAAGNALVFSTFFGGSNEDRPNGLALAVDGSIYVAGQTMSSNMPTTSGAHDTTHNGGWDAFVAKFNAAGSQLLYSTYLGGASTDWAFGVAAAPDGSAVVVGGAMSSGFPAIGGAYDATHNGSFDAFVVKMNPTGGTVAWSTFLGGSGVDQAMSVDVDANAAIYVAGTCGVGYPTTAGAYDVANDGGEAFVTKLSADGTSLVYSTLLGSSSTDQANAIKVDPIGAAYVAGFTNGASFPITTPTYVGTYGGGGSPAEGFFAKLSHDGAQLLFSTFVGSALNDEVRALALDVASAAYLVGTTQGSIGISGPGFDQSHNGVEDGFVLKLDVSPQALVTTLLAGCNWAAAPPVMGSTDPVLGSLATASGDGAPPSALGAVLIGHVPAVNSFLGYGCILQMSTVVIGVLAPTASDSNGHWTSSVVVAPVPANAGSVVRIQGLFLSSTHPLGYVLTNGLEVTLGY
jgi:hypothetical protein